MRKDDLWTIVWHLPEPALAVSIRLPSDAFFRFRGLDFTANPAARADGTLDYSWMLIKGLAVALVTALVLLLVQRWPPGWTVDAILVKKVLILGLIPAYATMIFLLPPFQGPDEYHHWKHVLQKCRPDPYNEICLYNLYEITGADRLKHNTSIQLPPQFLRSDAGGRLVATEPDPYVTYGTWFSHPFMWLVAWWFPRVETTREALFFLYLCRTLPAIVLLAVLWLANCKGNGPYTALVFFSLPLVMEQFTVVSSDTVPNLGALLAALLFQSAWRKPGWGLVRLSWFLAAAITLAKPPIYAGFVLLPIFATPWRSIPYKRFWVVPAILLILWGAILAWQYGLSLLNGGERDSTGAGNVALLQTWAGLNRFARLCADKLVVLLHYWQGWYQPLGWLDTGLSDFHHKLITAAFFLALGFDALDYAGRFFRWLGRHYLLARALFRGSDPANSETYIWDILGGYLQALMVVGIVAVNFLAIGVTDCLINFILYTQPTEEIIYGVQTRYFFPAGILAIFLPLCLIASPPDKQPTASRFPWFAPLIATLALSAFLWLWLARQIELTVDLLTRYW